MKCIIIEVDDVTAKNWKISGQEIRDRVARMVTRELKYPVGYARPDEKEAWERYKKNLAYLNAVEKLQKEAKKNGLTQEILDELLAEDEK